MFSQKGTTIQKKKEKEKRTVRVYNRNKIRSMTYLAIMLCSAVTLPMCCRAYVHHFTPLVHHNHFCKAKRYVSLSPFTEMAQWEANNNQPYHQGMQIARICEGRFCHPSQSSIALYMSSTRIQCSYRTDKCVSTRQPSLVFLLVFGKRLLMSSPLLLQQCHVFLGLFARYENNCMFWCFSVVYCVK